MFAVYPSLTPWRGDPRRNTQPYYIGQGVSWAELNQAQSCKAALERRGIACYITAIEKED